MYKGGLSIDSEHEKEQTFNSISYRNYRYFPGNIHLESSEQEAGRRFNEI